MESMFSGRAGVGREGSDLGFLDQEWREESVVDFAASTVILLVVR